MIGIGDESPKARHQSLDRQNPYRVAEAYFAARESLCDANELSMTDTDTDTDITTMLIAFLREIGISVREQHLDGKAFLPGLRVHAGGLIVDREALAWPGDLLHEAGHLAVLPAGQRMHASDDLDGHEAIPFAGEAEATAWAWAALMHLGLRPEVLFHQGGYRGRSAGLIETFCAGVYPGCHGLCQTGLSLSAADAHAEGVAPYPHMIRWLRE